MKKFTLFLCALMIAMSASAEVYNLDVQDKPYVSSNSWGEPQVYISMTSEENIGLTFYINGILELENGKTYTYADMDEWSSVGNYNTYQYSGLSDAAITWSVDADSLERFEGFVADTLGNTYNFLYQEKKFAPTGDTIQVSFSRVGNFEYSDWSECWRISGYDDYAAHNPYSVYFELKTDNDSILEGHFTEADFTDSESNHIYVSFEDKPSKNYKFLSADINVINRNDSTLCYAYALAEDGNVYDIYIYYADPKPLYHENISASMTVDTSGIQWGSVSFKAANADYEFSLNIWGNDSNYHGTYKYPDCYPSIYSLKDSVYLNVFSGEITITAGENGDILTGKVLCWNNTEYELYLTEGMPEKTREEVIIMTENVGLYQYEDPNKFIFWGCNADSSRIVSISILTDTVEGTFTIKDLELSNTYIGYDWNERGYVADIFHALTADLAVSSDPESGVTILTGTILAQSDYHVSDVPEFTILLKAEPAKPHLDYDTEDADFEAEYDEYKVSEAFDEGYVIVEAGNDSTQVVLAFFVAEGDSVFTTGTYNCSIKGEPMTVYTGSCDGMYVYPSFIMDWNYNLWFPYIGTVTVDEEGVIVVDALNTYERTIKIKLNPKKEQGIENIEKGASDLNKRLENGILIIEKNGVQYNVIGNVIK